MYPQVLLSTFLSIANSLQQLKDYEYHESKSHNFYPYFLFTWTREIANPLIKWFF